MSGCTLSGSNNVDRTPMQPTVSKDGHRPRAWRLVTSEFFKVVTVSQSSGDEFGILEDD